MFSTSDNTYPGKVTPPDESRTPSKINEEDVEIWKKTETENSDENKTQLRTGGNFKGVEENFSCCDANLSRTCFITHIWFFIVLNLICVVAMIILYIFVGLDSDDKYTYGMLGALSAHHRKVEYTGKECDPRTGIRLELKTTADGNQISVHSYCDFKIAHSWSIILYFALCLLSVLIISIQICCHSIVFSKKYHFIPHVLASIRWNTLTYYGIAMLAISIWNYHIDNTSLHDIMQYDMIHFRHSRLKWWENTQNLRKCCGMYGRNSELDEWPMGYPKSCCPSQTAQNSTPVNSSSEDACPANTVYLSGCFSIEQANLRSHAGIFLAIFVFQILCSKALLCLLAKKKSHFQNPGWVVETTSFLQKKYIRLTTYRRMYVASATDNQIIIKTTNFSQESLNCFYKRKSDYIKIGYRDGRERSNEIVAYMEIEIVITAPSSQTLNDLVLTNGNEAGDIIIQF